MSTTNTTLSNGITITDVQAAEHRGMRYITGRADRGACLWWAEIAGMQIIGSNTRAGAQQLAELYIDGVRDLEVSAV